MHFCWVWSQVDDQRSLPNIQIVHTCTILPFQLSPIVWGGGETVFPAPGFIWTHCPTFIKKLIDASVIVLQCCANPTSTLFNFIMRYICSCCRTLWWKWFHLVFSFHGCLQHKLYLSDAAVCFDLLYDFLLHRMQLRGRERRTQWIVSTVINVYNVQVVLSSLCTCCGGFLHFTQSTCLSVFSSTDQLSPVYLDGWGKLPCTAYCTYKCS